MAERTLGILMAGLIGIILLSGCLGQASPKNLIVNESPACPLHVQREDEIFTVSVGDPFMYTGRVPGPGIHVVGVDVSSPFYKNPLASESVPVHDDGTFFFSLNRSRTQDLGNVIPPGETYAPYRISFNFSPAGRHVYLNIVPEPADPQEIRERRWISIDPFGPGQVSAEFRNVTRDFTITGTTNLQDGDEVVILIKSTSEAPCLMSRPPGNYISRCGDMVKENVQVRKGTCGVNTWSFTVNSSSYRFSDPEYMLFVRSSPVSRNSTVWDSTVFRMDSDNPEYQDPDRPRIVDTYTSPK